MPLTCYVCVCVNACVWRICKEKKQTHINMGNIVYVCASVPFLWIWGLDSKGSGHWNVFIWFAFCLPITQRTPPRILSLQEKNAPYFHRSCYGSILEELFNLDSCGFFFQLERTWGKLFRHDGSMVLCFLCRWYCSLMSQIKQHILASLVSSKVLNLGLGSILITLDNFKKKESSSTKWRL